MIARATDLERLIVRVLRVGLGLSLITLAVGLFLVLVGRAPAAAALLLNLGLIILMATPMARVVASAISYAAEGDWKFFLITLSVLAVLAASVFTAFHIG